MIDVDDTASFADELRQIERREMIADSYGRETAAAVALVNRAVDLCLGLTASMEMVASDAPGVEMSQAQLDATRGLSSLKAGDSTPVTAADFAIQAIISSCLAKWFPEDAFMGEEDAAELRADPELCALTQELSGMPEAEMLAAIDRGSRPVERGCRYWVLDPIDGTKGFLTGQQYIVGLALIDGSSGEPVVGVMGNPRLHPEPSIMAAARGAGARLFHAGELGEPARPTNYMMRPTSWAKADYSAALPLPPRAPGAPPPVAGVDYPPWLVSRPMAEGSPLPFGADAAPGEVNCGALVKYWSVAVGAHAGFIQFNRSLKTWDHASGVVCVAESGGRVTDACGEPVCFLGREVPVEGGVICSAKEASDAVHARLIASVREARGSALSGSS